MQKGREGDKKRHTTILLARKGRKRQKGGRKRGKKEGREGREEREKSVVLVKEETLKRKK